MALEYKPIEIGVGFEVAAHRLAAMSKRDGYEFATVSAQDGAVSSISFREKDAEDTNTVFLINGVWHELVEVEEVDGE